jgi:hypothetical protein
LKGKAQTAKPSEVFFELGLFILMVLI